MELNIDRVSKQYRNKIAVDRMSLKLGKGIYGLLGANGSDGNPTLYHRITKSYFRTCPTRRCRSQAPFCLCALRMVSDHSEGTFERLRYPFGGDRPSQTPRQALSHSRVTAAG